MFPTIRDVASRANVSFQLASGVLGHRSYVYASEATRKTIFEAAEELGYVPNTSARILRGGASKILGVLIDSRAPEVLYGILAEIEQAADKLGYRILSAQAHDNPEKLMTAYQSLRQSGVDGILSFSHDYAQLNFHLDDRLKNDPKIVFVLNSSEGIGSSVDVDYLGGMTLAADHLRKNGYRRTALILLGGRIENLPSSCSRRLSGFRTACPQGEVILLKSSLNDMTALEKEFRSLVRRKIIPGAFDSAIVQNDNFAAILMRHLLAAGVRIPGDFGLIGWDNLLIAECLPVPLTSLSYDRKELARTVLDILLKKINGNTEPVRTLFPMKLTPRESSRNKDER